MANIRDDRGTFAGLIDATATERGLDGSLVEKDYWAVEALRAVQAGFAVDIGGQTEHIQPIFKGGTSLSKAFGLVERFSEDVDLLVPVPADDPKTYTQNDRSKVMKAVAEAVTELLGLEGERSGGRKGVDLHWRYPYDPVSGDPTGFGAEPAIRVELTVMGGTNPRTTSTVRSMIAEHATGLSGFPTFDDLDVVRIETLAPERTLVEKLAMLHDAASSATSKEPGRLVKAGRHYYDIAKLLSDAGVRGRLTPGWVAEIAADADAWSAHGGFPFTPRPDIGFASSPAFNDATLMDVIARSYDVALGWVWGERPTLEDCLDIVRANAALL